MYQHLSHTLPIFINEQSKYIILGSFPSVKSREVMFYYGHPRNKFFPILFKVFNEEHSFDASRRKEFLIKHEIALYDVIEECDIEGSSDSSITNVKPANIVSILKKYPNIKVIGITGGKAAKLFNRYLLDLVSSFNIKIVYLPSTSPANARISDEALVEAYKSLLCF